MKSQNTVVGTSKTQKRSRPRNGKVKHPTNMKFEFFNRLPSEIRNMIWELAVGIDDKGHVWKVKDASRHRIFFEDTFPIFYDRFPMFHINPPATMHTCRESRSISLRLLTVRDERLEVEAFDPSSYLAEQVRIFRPFRPELDWVYLAGEWLDLPFSDEMAGKIKHIALDFERFTDDPEEDKVGWSETHEWMDKLPRLTSLVVVLDEILARHGGRDHLQVLKPWYPTDVWTMLTIKWWRERLAGAECKNDVSWKSAAGDVSMKISVRDLLMPNTSPSKVKLKHGTENPTKGRKRQRR